MASSSKCGTAARGRYILSVFLNIASFLSSNPTLHIHPDRFRFEFAFLVFDYPPGCESYSGFSAD